MKPIGPYVAARDLTGSPGGEVRTLHATDRLTGMPVLLHVLPRPQPLALPRLPDHPALLPPSEGGSDGEAAYVVTELPPHAQPASDSLLAARGALAGLAALHEVGLTHGGVGPAQLWSVDGRVALAGAGLPWGEGAGPEGDLRALTATLEDLGGVPPALRGAPDSLSARELLARLTTEAPAPLVPTPPTPVKSGAPIILGEPDPAEAPLAPERELPQKRVVRLDAADTEPRQDVPPPAPPVSVAPAPPQVEVGPAEPAPVATPASEAGRVPPLPVVDLNLQEADLAALEADQRALASVRESLQDTAGEGPEDAPKPSAAAGARPSGHVTPRRVVDKPIRIGWEEDHSWRVVRGSRPAAPPSPPRSRWLLPALAAGLVLAAVLWVLLAARASGTGAPPVASHPAGACCDVRFTVRGPTGLPVRLSVDTAPAGAGVAFGQVLGSAPGVVRLPAAGTYTLRVAAEGYTPQLVTVEVPAGQPVAIDLGP